MSNHQTKVTTLDFATSKFDPHGLMSIEDADGYFLCDITGPFNVEFFESYARMYAAKFIGWPKERRLIAFSRFHRSMLCSLEAIDFFNSKKMRPWGVHNWYIPVDSEDKALSRVVELRDTAPQR